MSAPFTIAAYDLEEIGSRGNGSVAVKVAGYWSADAIRLYIRREWNWKPGKESSYEWRAELSHSSGGRETDPAKGGIKCDLEAETNFGAALIAISATGRAILAQVATLEAAYQKEAELSRIEREAAEASKQAAIDADPAIGEQAIEARIDAALKHMQGPDAPVSCQAVLNYLPRGQEQTQHNVCTLLVIWNGHTKRTTFRFNGSAVSRKEAVAKAAGLSARPVKTLG